MKYLLILPIALLASCASTKNLSEEEKRRLLLQSFGLGMEAVEAILSEVERDDSNGSK